MKPFFTALSRRLVSSRCFRTPPSSPSSLGRPLSTLLKDLPFLKQELARFDPTVPIESASTPPASWFTHPAFHALEMASVFAENPLCVGSTLHIPRPGDYFCGQVGTHPFIVLRDTVGKIKAFYNVCRHKGMRLVAGDKGQIDKTTFACPYHGWEYRLDGRLAKATRIRGIQNFSPKDYGLIEIPLHTWGPLIFLQFGRRVGKSRSSSSEGGVMEGEGRYSLAHLTPLRERLDAEFGFSTGLRHVARRMYRLKCNHKVVSDNFLDNAYHVPYAHPALGQALDLASYSATLHDRYSIQSCKGATPLSSLPPFHCSPVDNHEQAREGGGREAGGEAGGGRVGGSGQERVGAAALYAHVYPSLMLNRYGPWMDINLLFPLSHNTSEVVFDYFLEEAFIARLEGEEGGREGGLESFVRESLEASDEVQKEDIYLCENVQIGLESAGREGGREGGYDRGRYAPKVEYLDHAFHQWLARDLGEAVKKMEKGEKEGGVG